MNSNQLFKNNSEEFKDVIGRFPTKSNNNLLILLISVITIGLLLGWFIKSPDIVLAEIKVTAQKQPVTLVSKTAGIIKFKKEENNFIVAKGDYIAVLENSANEDQVRILKDTLQNFSFKSIPNFNKYTFALDYNLGEIQNYYFEFVKTIYELNQFYENNEFDVEISSLKEQVKKIKTSIVKKNEIIGYKKASINISKGKHLSDSILVNQGALIRLEYDQSKKQLLKELDEKASQENEIIRDKINIVSSSKKAIGLTIEKKKTLDNLNISLLTNYQNLINAINLWEEKYVFKSPFDGTYDFLKFVTNSDFIKQGEPVFSVLQSNNKIIGQALMPSNGAGKVKPGQSVIIKLDTYPYQEYGSLIGKVKSVSLIPAEEIYLVNIELPKGLVSDNGIELNFSKEMVGQAEIITEDKRLLSRLFEKIKHALDKKRKTDIVPQKENKEEKAYEK
ncbi:HlyD family efflux transporter periplasmic adaptor subunit [Flavobacterium oreochromis]|uniref:HlyD family efflux transporter periplasmic adaptor subunit n=1 Tax=Flavobacterium oreochromis TaxID=2906078 RepID=A0ABW8PAC2_9FLAO|nr:HlyD family efflux transporter periplasmic adaptor subunit [Flavobacterium oreochromis]OWP74395.1 hypothetical protein BWG23_14050 [Flavobacterium oreochromis]